MESSDVVWTEAEGGYTLAIVEGKLVCRNKKGKTLGTVPKKVKEGEVAEQLLALLEWLTEHERECSQTVEAWMLRSLPVSRIVLEQVWPDPSWRRVLEDAVVTPVDADGIPDGEAGGFFRGVDPERGIGVVDLDGETTWIGAQQVAIPHPILLADLADFRELAGEIEVTQTLGQLFRETWVMPADMDAKRTALEDYTGGKFEQLNHVLGRTRSLGYRVRGGYASTTVYEGGRKIEARFWIGAEYPDNETYTEDLIWVDDKEKPLPVASVGPVAYSEGHRMASQIYAGRVVEKEAQS